MRNPLEPAAPDPHEGPAEIHRRLANLYLRAATRCLLRVYPRSIVEVTARVSVDLPVPSLPPLPRAMSYEELIAPILTGPTANNDQEADGA